MLPTNLLLQNRYRIVRLIGQGGMGAVYEAHDQRLAHTVALKQIMRGDAVAFAQEARLLARLRHPALPHVTDHFIEDNGQFLVMEYVPGDDLAMALQRRQTPFPQAEVLQWADQLLTTLTYLHSQTPPVLHRDIKPANLKVTHQHRLLLLDFGLAKDRAGVTTEPQKSAKGYTLAYAAPEQIRGEGTDARSDLYSVAATLYHLLTGSRPPDAIQRALLVADGQADPLFATLPARHPLSAIMVAILQKAMMLNPAHRFTDAAAMQNALHSATQGDATQLATVVDAPPIRPVVIASPPIPPNNLPTRLTSLIGRAAEIAELGQWLARPTVRLLTLTGAGGSGKTSLALAVAQAMLTTTPPLFPDGIYFINLAPIHDPALVASTIAQVLGVKEEAGKPLLASLQAYAERRRLLLVLDNFEQIVAAAPLLSDLLTTCATLTIIVTSREVLRIRGEHEFLVPLLALPTPNHQATVAEVSQFAAVQLFAERVQALKPTFVLDESNAAAVAEIVTRLDGLPLAIELAASHSKLLSPQAILARLQDRFKLLRSNVRDLPDRQRTLRAAIDWSYDLLTPDEQTLFRRLAVFVGGRTLEAVEAVCNPPDHPDLPPLATDVLDGLSALMDKSLLYQAEGVDGEPRFMMLVTIYAYAMEQLHASHEVDALQHHHADYYSEFVRKIETKLFSADLPVALDQIEAELGNLRAAVDWSLQERDQAEIGLTIAGQLWRFWALRGYATEGRARLAALLAKSGHLQTFPRCYALHTAGNLASDQGDYQAATNYFEGCLQLAEQLNRKHIASHMYNNLGNIANNQCKYEQAQALYAKALAGYRERNATWNVAMVLCNLGNVASIQGSYPQAQLLLDEGLTVAQQAGDQQLLALLFHNLALTAHRQMAYETATEFYAKALALFREVGDKDGIASIWNGLGRIAKANGDAAQALRYYHESLGFFAEIGNQSGIAATVHNLGELACLCGQYAEAQVQYQKSLRLRQTLQEQWGSISSLEGLAAVAIAVGNVERGTRLLGTAAKLRETLGTPLPADERPAYEEAISTAWQSLHETPFALVWATGQDMSVEQAIDYALTEVA